MYKKHSIKITNQTSFKEEQANNIAKQLPIDRIKETVQLIIRVYSFKNNLPKSNRVYIDKQ